MSFYHFINNIPLELLNTIDKTKSIDEDSKYHPEESLFDHIEMVFNRLSEKYKDINLEFAAIFHDLGKLDTFTIDEFGKKSAHGHEIVSLDYIDKFNNVIEDYGGNIDIVKFVVKNHMRVKYFDEMKHTKKVELLSEPYVSELLKFESADYGGYDPNCRELRNVDNLVTKLKTNKRKMKFQNLLDKFYIRGWLFIKKNEFYILKNKKPYIINVNKKIRNGNRIEIKI